KVFVKKPQDKEVKEKGNKSIFLFFFIGYEPINTTPYLSNFRKPKDEIISIIKENLLTSPKKNKKKPQNLRVNEPVYLEKFSNPHIGLSNWIKKLTESQKKFVFSNSFGPDILKGAAGSGK
ncbi:DNA helicase UvrD, partial [Klebsiella pneumoniae]